MNGTNETVFASVADAARRIGLGENYLRKRLGEGRVPYIYSGRKVLINVPKLVEILTIESTDNIRGCSSNS